MNSFCYSLAMNSTPDAAAAFSENLGEVLRKHGVQEALRHLNAGVPHRYTAVFVLDGDLLRNLYMVDKLGEARPEQLAVVPLGSSFCQFVLRDGRLCTEDSRDERLLDGSPYQGMVIAYHGVPLTHGDGRLAGTLCHFDLVRQSLSEAQFERLQQAARLLSEHVLRAASPRLPDQPGATA